MGVFSKPAVGLAALLAALPRVALASSHTESSYNVLHFYGNGPLLEGRMDPVVNPGIVSPHVHTVQGGNAFALTMDDGFASDATCTSSLIVNDKSNYWAPKLYFQSPTNGTFYDVPLYYMNVYYFFDATDDDLVAFPPGFRMTSGDPFLRSPPYTSELVTDTAQGEIQPVEWVCPRMESTPPAWPAGSDGSHVGIGNPTNAGAGVGFPNQNCDGLYSPMRADIHFPSCYDPAAGLDNYQTNTAWPGTDSTTGRLNCPPGYIHVPHLFYELYWNTPLFADDWTPGGDSQPFVLAMGDPLGYGLHGDFISGWDEDTLQYAIDNCDAGDGGLDTCAGLPGGVLDGSSTSCNMVTPFEETITGALAALPGCNPVQWGPATATQAVCGPSPVVTSSDRGVLATGTATASVVTGTVGVIPTAAPPVSGAKFRF